MLVRIFGRNFGVFRDDFSLSLEATNLPTHRGHGYFEVPLAGEKVPLRLLRLIALYGPNASGKSTIIRAATTLHELVRNSARSTQFGSGIADYFPFRLDPKTAAAPCLLGCEVVVGDRIIRYQIEFNDEFVLTEQIVEYRGRRELRWLDRTAPDTIRIAHELLPGKLSADLADQTRPNATALSVAAFLNQKPLLPLFQAINKSLMVLDAHEHECDNGNYSVRKLHTDKRVRSWALHHLIGPADLGVINIETRQQPIPPDLRERLRTMSGQEKWASVESLVFPSLEHRGTGGSSVPIPFEDESTGTQKMLALAGPWYDMIHDHLTVFADELAATLHPSLLIALLDAVNSAPASIQAQLVVTLHDPSPLESALRRDQVWLTEKDDDGAARLFAVSDFRKERAEHNLRKRYLEGRFGGVPRLAPFDLIAESDGTE